MANAGPTPAGPSLTITSVRSVRPEPIEPRQQDEPDHHQRKHQRADHERSRRDALAKLAPDDQQDVMHAAPPDAFGDLGMTDLLDEDLVQRGPDALEPGH